MTHAVDQDPWAEVPESAQYQLGRSYAAALELDPDSDPAAVVLRVRIALRIVDHIETTCGWTDAVRAGFRAGAPRGEEASRDVSRLTSSATGRVAR